jgi:hypothetical protein
MKSLRRILAAASMALLAGTSMSQTAEARIKAGVLTCEVESGVAFVVSSPRDLHCVFYGQNGRHEAYGGRIQEAGIDIGVSGRGVISWTVISEANRLGRGALRGRYSGVEAGAAIGIGGTGRVLVGGNRRSISLQPLSIETRSGLNLALGIASMNLYPLFTTSSRPSRAPAPAVGHDEEAVPHHRVVPHYGCGSYTHLQEYQTLSGLAHACGVSLEALLQANPQITNVRNISVGALVHIPSHVSHTGDSPCGTRTILNEDEALDHAAWRCGITLHALLTANPEVRDLDAVRAGLVLKIPERREANAAPPVRYVPTERNANEPDQTTISLDRLSTAKQDGDDRRQDRMDAPRYAREIARLEVRCQEAAADKYAMDIGRIDIERARRAGSDSYSVSLNANGEEAVCLIDRRGNILFLSEPGGPQEGGQTRIASSAIGDVQSRLTPNETLEQLAISETGETRRSGQIEGYNSAVYMFDGYAGEVLDISFDADSNSAYFNVVSADNPDGAAIYIGSSDDDRQTRLTIPSDGLYLIRPYLVRAAARRNEEANYTLSISIVRMGETQQNQTTRAVDPADDGGGAMAGSEQNADDGGGAMVGSSNPADAKVSGTPFNATGQLSCVRDADAAEAQCDFGVVRNGDGTGYIQVTWPDGGMRIINFENNTPADFDKAEADGDAKMTVTKSEDGMFVVLIGQQRFEFPEAVIVGG